MIVFLGLLAAVTATACYFIERIDRPLRRAKPAGESGPR